MSLDHPGFDTRTNGIVWCSLLNACLFSPCSESYHLGKKLLGKPKRYTKWVYHSMNSIMLVIIQVMILSSVSFCTMDYVCICFRCEVQYVVQLQFCWCLMRLGKVEIGPVSVNNAEIYRSVSRNRLVCSFSDHFCGKIIDVYRFWIEERRQSFWLTKARTYSSKQIASRDKGGS